MLPHRFGRTAGSCNVLEDFAVGRAERARSRTRTWECRSVGPMPWPLGEASDHWCTREDLNLHAAGAAASEAAAFAVSPRVRCCLVLAGGLEPPVSRLRGERS